MSDDRGPRERRGRRAGAAATGPEPGARVAGLVLAAGPSTRMRGRFKLLLPYGETTVVRAAVEAARAGGLDPVVAVVGHRAAEVTEALSGSGVRVVENPAYREGMGGTLAVGVRALDAEPGVEAVAILLGDEPGVRPETVRAAVEAWRSSRPVALRTVYRDRPGHPVLFERSALPVLGRLRGDRGATEILRASPERVARLEVDLAAPVDVDTRADYAAAIRAAPG